MTKVTINKAYVEKYVADGEYPEVGELERKDLQKFYKHLTDVQLEDWLELEGLQFTPNESAPINRMRMCMAILYFHYPKAPAKKKQSKYAQYSLEDLLTMAIDNDVPVEMTDDERIMRMRTIMALRAAKHID